MDQRMPPAGPQGSEELDPRSEEHTSELQSRLHLVCRLLLEKNTRRQVDIKSIVASNIGTSQRPFRVKKLNHFSRPRRNTHTRKHKRRAILTHTLTGHCMSIG